MQNHKLGLLLNPASGKIKKQIVHIRKYLADIPELTVKELSSTSKLNHELDALLKMKITHLVVMGGDGTVQSVLSCCLNNYPAKEIPQIVLVPGGTTNMTATDLGVRDINTGLKMIKELASGSNQYQTIDKPLVKLEASDNEIHYGFFFGMGTIASGVNYFNQHVKKSGITGEVVSAIDAARYVLKLFLTPGDSELSQPVSQLVIDDIEKKDSDIRLLFSTTLDRLLFGLMPYWGTNSSPLHVTLITTSAKQLWRSLWKIITQRGASLSEQDGYFSNNSSRVNLNFAGYYIIDGEIFHTQNQNTLRISASEPLRFVVP